MTDEKMMQLAINTIRTLSIDAVHQAKPGRPGTPMALAPLKELQRKFGFEPDQVATAAKELLGRN
jgi:Transketolase, thiamine diphosphate binding domain